MGKKALLFSHCAGSRVENRARYPEDRIALHFSYDV